MCFTFNLMAVKRRVRPFNLVIKTAPYTSAMALQQALRDDNSNPVLDHHPIVYK